ncbi:bacterial regulatory s, tetR family protein [Mycobacteroides abscessus]|nr:bacterial regulatory s, tetR family protein [Mycobacteroides abscessus]
MRLEDLGSAVGISGPAIYRHFPNKEALLVDLLTDVSRRLLEGGMTVAAAASSPAEALDGLIDFHLDFALNESDLIRVQDRDLDSLRRTRVARYASISDVMSRPGYRCYAAASKALTSPMPGSRHTRPSA